MEADRSVDILLAGLTAAHKQVFKGANTPKMEYPHDFARLYGWAENALFSLYEAVKAKQHAKIREAAADVIVLMSEIIDLAGITDYRLAFGKGKE
jgi:hypothetical protein